MICCKLYINYYSDRYKHWRLGLALDFGVKVRRAVVVVVMCSCCICRWTRSKPPWFRWASQPQNDKYICVTMCELWITLTTRQILSINSTNTKLWTWSNKRFRACQRIEALGGSRPPGPDVCSPDLIDQQNHTRPASRPLSILKRVPQNRYPPFEACKSYQGHGPRHFCSRVSVHNWSAMKHRSVCKHAQGRWRWRRLAWQQKQRIDSNSVRSRDVARNGSYEFTELDPQGQYVLACFGHFLLWLKRYQEKIQHKLYRHRSAHIYFI